MLNTVIYPQARNFSTLRKLVAHALPHVGWRRHGIGCLQGYIHESMTGDELRVHVWSRELMLPGIDVSGNAHNHRFKLRSHVLVGTLKHTEWNLNLGGTGYTLYDFVNARNHTDETRSDMRRIDGEVGCDRHAYEIYPGSTYEFARGAFHDSLPLSDIVVTLCEKIDHHADRARVVAPAAMPPVPAFGGEGVPASLLLAILDRAEEALLSGA